MPMPFNPWQEYRRRRNLALFALLGYVPGVSLIEWAARREFGTAPPTFVVVIGWLIFFVVAAFREESFRCPQCRGLFFAKLGYHNPFARQCVHCGLPKYVLPNPVEIADSRV